MALGREEARALERIRHRASRALACSTARTLADDLATTTERAAWILCRLAYKGWIVSDCNQIRWLPTSMAGLAYRMAEVEALMRGLAGLDPTHLPADLRKLHAGAADLLADCGPENGHVPHPVGNVYRSAESMHLKDRRGIWTHGDALKTASHRQRAYDRERRLRKERAARVHALALERLAAEEDAAGAE